VGRFMKREAEGDVTRLNGDAPTVNHAASCHAAGGGNNVVVAGRMSGSESPKMSDYLTQERGCGGTGVEARQLFERRSLFVLQRHASRSCQLEKVYQRHARRAVCLPRQSTVPLRGRVTTTTSRWRLFANKPTFCRHVVENVVTGVVKAACKRCCCWHVRNHSHALIHVVRTSPVAI